MRLLLAGLAVLLFCQCVPLVPRCNSNVDCDQIIFHCDTLAHKCVRGATASGEGSSSGGLPRSSSTRSLEKLTGGLGGAGYQDGTGSAAAFDYPTALAVRNDVLLVADYNNHVIRQVTVDGVVTTLIGCGASSTQDGAFLAASFDVVSGLALSLDKNILYVSDSSANGIRAARFDTGTVETVAGGRYTSGFHNGTRADATFDEPLGLAVGSDGTLYIADRGNQAIRALSTDGGVSTLTSWDSGSEPRGLAAENGVLYVADYAGRVFSVTLDGSAPAPVTTLFHSQYVEDPGASVADLNNPCTIIGDGTGGLLVGDDQGHAIHHWAGGQFTARWIGSGAEGHANGTASQATFDNPNALARIQNTLYVADIYNGTIRAVDAQRNVTTLAGTPPTRGGDNGALDQATFARPREMVMDSLGVLHVLDSNGLRSVDTGGQVRNLASAGSPAGLAVSNNGNTLYLSYNDEHVIRRVERSSPSDPFRNAPTPYVGQQGTSGDQDGTTEVTFSGPSTLAVGDDDTLYIATIYSHRIRRLVPSTGVVDTLAGKADGGSVQDDNLCNAAGLGQPTALAVFQRTLYFASTNALWSIDLNSPAADCRVRLLAGYSGHWGFNDGDHNHAQFGEVRALAVDSRGNLLAADSNALRLITPAGDVTTLVGAPEKGRVVLGPLIAAQLNMPLGVAADTRANGSGRIYLTSENAVLYITP